MEPVEVLVLVPVLLLSVVVPVDEESVEVLVSVLLVSVEEVDDDVLLDEEDVELEVAAAIEASILAIKVAFASVTA